MECRLFNEINDEEQKKMLTCAGAADEEYKEGIFVGYRWADRQKTKPCFAFGHGLSYTTFKISDLRLDSHETSDGNMTYTVHVTNTGQRKGSEVVQLYLSDVKSSVERPVKELKAFRRITLNPGESSDVTLTTDRRALSFWDETAGNWKVEPGEFQVLIGNASDNITCKAKFVVK